MAYLGSRASADGPDYRELWQPALFAALGALLMPVSLIPARAMVGAFGPALTLAIPFAVFGGLLGKGLNAMLHKDEETNAPWITAAGFGIGAFFMGLLSPSSGAAFGSFVVGMTGGLGISFAFLHAAWSRAAATGASAVGYGLISTLLPLRIGLVSG
ncbi:MAG TPA: hypothetical protein PKA37_08545 [Planctomycetota bacterium]|jgi:hypothetical protein|nr:hypothetical protein [Planctomycetota bacterium]